MCQCYNKCPEYMIRLSNAVRQVNKTNIESQTLQNSINHLMQKLDEHGHANNVAHVLLQDIVGTSSARLIPVLRMVVKCVTKVRGNVFNHFEFWLADSIEDIFEYMCQKNNTGLKIDLMTLRKEWRAIFSFETLNDIDQRLHKLDRKWPIFEKPQVSSLPKPINATIPPTTPKINSSSLVQQAVSSTENEVTKSDSLKLLGNYESSTEPLRTKSPSTMKSKLNSKESNTFTIPQYQTKDLRKMLIDKRSTFARHRLSSIGSSSNSDKENDAECS